MWGVGEGRPETEESRSKILEPRSNKWQCSVTVFPTCRQAGVGRPAPIEGRSPDLLKEKRVQLEKQRGVPLKP